MLNFVAIRKGISTTSGNSVLGWLKGVRTTISTPYIFWNGENLKHISTNKNLVDLEVNNQSWQKQWKTGEVDFTYCMATLKNL